MSERAAELSSQFEQANRDFIDEVDRLTDDQWRILGPGENWTVGVVAHHVVDSFGLIVEWIKNLARGEEAVYDRHAVDAHNAEHALAYAGCTQSDTADAARSDGAATARFVASLSDAQLDTVGVFNGNPRTPTQLIERVLIGHTKSHLINIRSVIA